MVRPESISFEPLISSRALTGGIGLCSLSSRNPLGCSRTEWHSKDLQRGSSVARERYFIKDTLRCYSHPGRREVWSSK